MPQPDAPHPTLAVTHVQRVRLEGEELDAWWKLKQQQEEAENAAAVEEEGAGVVGGVGGRLPSAASLPLASAGSGLLGTTAAQRTASGAGERVHTWLASAGLCCNLPVVACKGVRRAHAVVLSQEVARA